MYSRVIRILCRFHTNLTLAFSEVATFLHSFATSLKGKVKNKYSNQDQLENNIRDMAEVLVNMIVMGKEKRNLCMYYDVASGLCKYVKMDMEIPTLKTVKEGDVYRVSVSIHPEICAVCPFWIKKLA